MTIFGKRTDGYKYGILQFSLIEQTYGIGFRGIGNEKKKKERKKKKRKNYFFMRHRGCSVFVSAIQSKRIVSSGDALGTRVCLAIGIQYLAPFSVFRSIVLL